MSLYPSSPASGPLLGKPRDWIPQPGPEAHEYLPHAPVFQSSATTTAIDTVRECDKLSDIRRIPNPAAISAARPLKPSSGRPPGIRLTSNSFQLTPRLIPVPSAFAPASLAANRAARLSAEFFFRWQYAISPGV